MNYVEARSLIRDGDCIAVKTRSVGGWVVRLGQHIAVVKWAKYGHTGIALWEDVAGEKPLMVLQRNQGGNMYRPLSQYVREGCEVASFNPPKNASLSSIFMAVREAIYTCIPYGWLHLIPLGLQLVLRRFIGPHSLGKDGGQNQVCSYFTKQVYATLGAKFEGVPNRPAPAEVLEDLELKFEIEA